MSIHEGLELFLLRDETVNHSQAAKHQIATVTEVDHEERRVKLMVETDDRWGRAKEKEVSLEELADTERFLLIKAQFIDGLDFRPEVPDQDGYYWFYGITGKMGGLKLLTVRIRRYDNRPAQFWCGSDMQFGGKNFGMRGLWAPAFRPRMPGMPAGSES